MHQYYRTLIKQGKFDELKAIGGRLIDFEEMREECKPIYEDFLKKKPPKKQNEPKSIQIDSLNELQEALGILNKNNSTLSFLQSLTLRQLSGDIKILRERPIYSENKLEYCTRELQDFPWMVVLSQRLTDYVHHVYNPIRVLSSLGNTRRDCKKQWVKYILQELNSAAPNDASKGLATTMMRGHTKITAPSRLPRGKHFKAFINDVERSLKMISVYGKDGYRSVAENLLVKIENARTQEYRPSGPTCS